MEISPSSPQPVKVNADNLNSQVDAEFAALGVAVLEALISSLTVGNLTTQSRLEITKLGSAIQTNLAQLKGQIKLKIQASTTGMSDQQKTDTINQTNQYNQNITNLQQAITQQIVAIKQTMQQTSSQLQGDMQKSSQVMQQAGAILSMLDKIADQINKITTPKS
jgi:hypothetical protein